MSVQWHPCTLQTDSNLEVLGDQVLLNIYQTGKPEQRNRAFDVIYHRYRLEIECYIQKKIREEWKCKEVFSDVWAKASDKFKTFVWNGIPLNHWLLQKAKYTILDGYKEEKRRHKFEIITDFTDSASDRIEKAQTEPDIVVEEFLQKEGDQRFLQIVNLLKNDLQRQILILRYFGELTFEEIAQQLGKKANYIRANHSRALKKLAQHLPERSI